jgi:hypothetical protein
VATFPLGNNDVLSPIVGQLQYDPKSHLSSMPRLYVVGILELHLHSKKLLDRPCTILSPSSPSKSCKTRCFGNPPHRRRRSRFKHFLLAFVALITYFQPVQYATWSSCLPIWTVQSSTLLLIKMPSLPFVLLRGMEFKSLCPELHPVCPNLSLSLSLSLSFFILSD